jgi:nicotinamide mononucleotide transporter
LEYIAVVSGIVSVWFSRKESVLVYPVGLIGTIIYVYLSLVFHLPGEASVNLYYTIMSFYGWFLWTRRNSRQEKIIHITFSDTPMWRKQVLFFLFFYAGIFLSLVYLKGFFNESIPWADAFASATAFTGMWLMTRKKVESWYWWIATNIASIPLYFVKGLVVTSVYYFVLLLLAFWGLATWNKKAQRFIDIPH